METLSTTTCLALQLTSSSNRLQTNLFHKPIFSFSLTPQNKFKLKLSSATSPTVSTTPPFSPELESDGEENKFDWFSHWYPIAAICDLDKKVPHARKVIGLDIVIWWDRNEGKWKVFDDSCPHRLAPLSQGRIDQWGRLQCVYHGWCFNGSGDCKFIPQAPPDGPQIHTSKKACASAYPSFEQNKILWFWPRSEPQYKDIGAKEQPPCVPELDDPSFTSLLMSRDLPYGYEVLIENLMDPAHVPYAHYGILTPNVFKMLFIFHLPVVTNTLAFSTVKADREGGMPLEINITKLDKYGFLAKQDNGFNKFVAPCLFYYFSSLSSDGEPSKSGSIKKKTSQKQILLVFYCIPVSPGKSRVLFSFPRNFAVWVDQIIPRWILHIRSNLVLDSDLYLLHLEERKLTEIGHSNWQKICFVPTKSDNSVIAFRNWLRKYSGSQFPWGTKFSAEMLPTPPKELLMDRYWSHVVNCSSCSKAVKRLKALEVALQVISIASIGIIAIRQSVMSMAAKTSVVSFAVLCFAASRWLSQFIYKIFYFHDFNHAVKSTVLDLEIIGIRNY
ncbi:hypothetical protein IFM89_012278 [Coptis chinensis]|uniref:Rieske domain-containing protein n=1 Tax=Coptis chinensis TaxID=261450 RepID=A0A835HDV4_9MAGN|nr:hypothetical protein IFM89_012278 [Coptis chinensis]